MIVLKIKKKLKGYSGDFILDVDLSIEKKQITALFGSSGAGKTTILRILSGLETPDEGFIEVNGKVYFDSKKGINLPPQKRNVGYVFQNYALFPNMTVLENILFAMEKKDLDKTEEILEIIELKELKDRYPDTLSGGQQQRVALGRAIAKKPELLLLDEPLSALDHSIRMKLQNEIKKIHEMFNLTTVLVSHEKTEVFRLSDRVIWIDKGKILKDGSPRQVFIEKKISGKFSFIGTVLKVEKCDVISIATIEIGENLVEVVISDKDKIKSGDRVLVSSKAFNPVIKRL
ncbi:sulfate/molybdate ABC transporter ATP-binding protein [Persephonella sp.]